MNEERFKLFLFESAIASIGQLCFFCSRRFSFGRRYLHLGGFVQ